MAFTKQVLQPRKTAYDKNVTELFTALDQLETKAFNTALLNW